MASVERAQIPSQSFEAFSKPQTDLLRAQSPFLKAHMKDGGLYVFSRWNYNDRSISGSAGRFDADRLHSNTADIVLGLDSVALLETNVIKQSGPATAMTVFTGITAAVTVYCITNPKACFGSCPTFYVSGNGEMRLDAEGFSSSIAPSLEDTDVDALPHAHAQNGLLSIQMRNEALETHVLRYVDVLAVPRGRGDHIYRDLQGRFWKSPRQIQPTAAHTPEGDCLSDVRLEDGVERRSVADKADLAAKETLELRFRVERQGSYGLVISCRQSLLPTYLLYQTLAYMGNEAGRWLSRPDLRSFGTPMDQLLGGIEAASVGSHSPRHAIGTIREHGPLARDIHLLHIGQIADTSLSVELKMTKGMWRIDYVALVELGEVAEPIRLLPDAVFKGENADSTARAKLIHRSQPLVTTPGDVYTLTYVTPHTQREYEFFLESRGYYLEWMRREWIQEQSPQLLLEMFASPETALRRLAPEFKRSEPEMEECFWRSRYAEQ